MVDNPEIPNRETLYGAHVRALTDRTEALLARAGYDRARDLLAACADADLSAPLALDGPPEDGVHLLVLDELLYAADRGLVAPDEVCALLDAKPDALELVLTGSHARPEYLVERADLVTRVAKEKHPFDDGQRARKGTEY